jgi:UDP-N-acetylglucosamine--N-acetylmuramyl-(pentapeptide) pyrophosphoryl-undecaprenol N-acetylglucosamine transferase
MGRANRFLAGRATLIATGFAQVKGVAAHLHGKCHHVGNPVRPAVVEAAGRVYAPLMPGGKFHILVTGGSQGARVMAEVVPAAMALLEPDLRGRIVLAQQARGEDEVRVRSAYAKIGFHVDIQPFFKDLPNRIAASHLVIGRSGASTVAELAVIGRPSILVPLPGSLDQDQAANAAVLADAGAAIRILQPEFTPNWLVKTIRSLVNEPQRLTTMAHAAKSAGIEDAAARLADLVVAALPVRPNTLPASKA